MAVVTALRFTPFSGAICVDQESWHIWRRKNWFSDHIYPLVSEDISERFSLELIYAGTGHPPFHLEVAEAARIALIQKLENSTAESESLTVPALSHVVLDAFQAVHRRRVDDKLRFLYGFDSRDLTAGEFRRDGKQYGIAQKDVRDRALSIIQCRETTGYNPLSPKVEACLVGIDRRYGYSAFVMKESEGVISFQSCWFESLGQGRDAAAIRFADLLNRQTLNSRREGAGFETGLITLVEATDDAMQYYGQNGGFIRMILLNGREPDRSRRRIDLHDQPARLVLEIIRATRNGFFGQEQALDMLKQLIESPQSADAVETEMFRRSRDAGLLGKFLRGYKISEPNLPGGAMEPDIFGSTSNSNILRGADRS